MSHSGNWSLRRMSFLPLIRLSMKNFSLRIHSELDLLYHGIVRTSITRLLLHVLPFFFLSLLICSCKFQKLFSHFLILGSDDSTYADAYLLGVRTLPSTTTISPSFSDCDVFELVKPFPRPKPLLLRLLVGPPLRVILLDLVVPAFSPTECSPDDI